MPNRSSFEWEWIDPGPALSPQGWAAVKPSWRRYRKWLFSVPSRLWSPADYITICVWVRKNRWALEGFASARSRHGAFIYSNSAAKAPSVHRVVCAKVAGRHNPHNAKFTLQMFSTYSEALHNCSTGPSFSTNTIKQSILYFCLLRIKTGRSGNQPFVV